MPEIKIYNQSGEKAGNQKLSEFVFGLEPKQELIHQVYIAAIGNRREPWAHVKDRSEVRGGGRKPWRQKGTGRARHGSIRSPIWTGGGVTFGPRKTRNFKTKINKKIKSKAVRMCLSDKVAGNNFLLLEDFSADGKTKTMVELLKRLPMDKRNTLILVKDKDEKLALSIRNLNWVGIKRAIDLNVVDLLLSRYILADKNAVLALENRFEKKDKK